MLYCRNCDKYYKNGRRGRKLDRTLCPVCDDPLTGLSPEELKKIDEINRRKRNGEAE